MILLLIACLTGDDKVQYDLGYEDGCELGKNAGSRCPLREDTGIDAEDGNPYSEGFSDGYHDCWEQWSGMTICG